MRQKVTWADHAAGVKGRLPRQRTSKWVWMRLSTPVSIGEDEALSEPEALVISYERFTTDRAPRKKETVRRAIPGHEGALWRKLQDGRGQPLTPESLSDAEVIGRSNYWPFQRPFSRFGELLPPEGDVMLSMSFVEVDGRPAQRARAAKVAEGIADIAGALWRKDTEPTWIVGLHEGRAILDYGRSFSKNEMPGLRIRIDHREEAEAMARALGTKGKPKLSKMRVERADPNFLSAETISATTLALTNAVAAIRREAKLGGYAQADSVPADTAFRETWVPGAEWTKVASCLRDYTESVSILSRRYGNQWNSQRFDFHTLGYDWARMIEASVEAGLFPRHVGETAAAAPDTDEWLSDLGM